ncbi:hypothetical protein NE237_030141 [Protea cynaroides]|uniref:Uncharacterized protein n=1 Tax=Protea cynaroides TaxID=273540 RepID=A0A9Q0GTI0_9MAGN|nr:hypothetical protein NE237_030141 [Protea cynaroides]
MRRGGGPALEELAQEGDAQFDKFLVQRAAVAADFFLPQLKFQVLPLRLQQHYSNILLLHSPTLPHFKTYFLLAGNTVLLAEISEAATRRQLSLTLTLLFQVFKSLYENASNSVHVGAHLAILMAIRDVCKLIV